MEKSLKLPARIAFIGIGNTIAGNDGAGIVALERLEKLFSAAEKTEYLFATITGDLFGITNYLGAAERFIFLDAIAGNTPGELRVIRSIDLQPLAPSFHQTDISSVMESLYRIRFIDPFPFWEVRGIIIAPPAQLREGLDPVIDRAADRLASSQ